MGGQIFGRMAGGGGPGAATGANLLSTLGFSAGQEGWLGLGALGGPGGALLGGLVGGLFGGLFDKEEEELRRSIDKNTDAIQSNTRALEEFSKVIINAPPNYTIPSFTGGATGLSIGQINIYGNGTQDQANSFVRALSEYDIDIRRSGSRYINRIN